VDNVRLPRVSTAVLFAIFMQSIFLVWGGSQVYSTVNQNASDIVSLQVEINTMERTVQAQAVSMARIDENIKAIRISVEQALRTLDLR
jgi:cell division protein FtsB